MLLFVRLIQCAAVGICLYGANLAATQMREMASTIEQVRAFADSANG